MCPLLTHLAAPNPGRLGVAHARFVRLCRFRDTLGGRHELGHVLAAEGDAALAWALVAVHVLVLQEGEEHGVDGRAVDVHDGPRYDGSAQRRERDGGRRDVAVGNLHRRVDEVGHVRRDLGKLATKSSSWPFMISSMVLCGTNLMITTDLGHDES